MPRFGADIYAAPPETMDVLQADRGKPLTAGAFYSSIDTPWNLSNIDRQARIRDAGGVVELNVNTARIDPATGSKVGVSWREIIAGSHDDWLAAWAAVITAFASPRLAFTVGGHECNIDNPNQPKAADFDVTDYPALAHKVREFFAAAGVTNRVLFFPTISSYQTGPHGRPPLIDSFMPDPADYDLIGCDHYTHCRGWQTVEGKAAAFLAKVAAVGKPFFVGEVGNDCADDRRVQWYLDAVRLYGKAKWVNWNFKHDAAGDFGLAPGTPEYVALLAATGAWS